MILGQYHWNVRRFVRQPASSIGRTARVTGKTRRTVSLLTRDGKTTVLRLPPDEAASFQLETRQTVGGNGDNLGLKVQAVFDVFAEGVDEL